MIQNELNRAIQVMRKEAGYAVSDRIILELEGNLAAEWKKHIAELALAQQKPLPEKEADATKHLEIEGRKYRISIKKNPNYSKRPYSLVALKSANEFSRIGARAVALPVDIKK